MHEGDHGILDDTNKEFEEKFGCSDCKSTNQVQKQHHKEHGGNEHQHHDHDHDHSHDHPHPHPHVDHDSKSNKNVEIISGIIVGLLIMGFIVWRFFFK